MHFTLRSTETVWNCLAPAGQFLCAFYRTARCGQSAARRCQSADQWMDLSGWRRLAFFCFFAPHLWLKNLIIIWSAPPYACPPCPGFRKASEYVKNTLHIRPALGRIQWSGICTNSYSHQNVKTTLHLKQLLAFVVAQKTASTGLCATSVAQNRRYDQFCATTT